MGDEHETSRHERQVFEPDAETEVRDELDFHLAMRAREYVARGMHPAEAREAALRRFGNLESLGTECRRLAEERDRTMRRAELTTELLQDVRYALRQLRRAPGFTTAAVLTLALGIGATAAMFGAVDTVLLRPLPLPAADRLVVPQSENVKDGERWTVTYADYEDWREARVFESVAVYMRGNANVAGDTDAERVPLAQVSEDFFRALRIAPVVGTTFAPNDFNVGSPRRILLSHGLWQRRFGGDPTVVGKMIRVGGRPTEVVGVLPAEQSFPSSIDVWMPLWLDADDLASVRRRDNFIFEAIARLAPGKTFGQTQTELAGLARRVAVAEPTTRGEVSVNISRISDWTVGETVTRTLWLLFAAVAMVLLIGCVNVANLLLGRSAARARELAIRTGLGATRGRITRQLVTESLVLSLVAGMAGVLLAVIAVRALVAAAPPNVPRLDAIGVDAKVFVFAFVASVFCALLFGVLPALRAARAAVADALASGSHRTTWSVRARRRRGVLVVAEIALALMLLIGASLLLRSFANLRATDPGFDTERLLTFSLSLQGERYANSAVRPAAYTELGNRLAAVPGVRDVAFASALPLGGGGFYLGRSFLFEGQAEPPATEAVSGMWNAVTPNYFATMGIRLLEGRDFTAADAGSSVPVMIVSREFVRQMFAGQSPLGRRVRSWRDENVYRAIVGVVDDVRFFGAGDEIRPIVYVPYAQDSWNAMAAVMRTNVPPGTLADAAREVVRAFDATLGTANARSFDEVFADSVAASRFTAYLLGILASLALALALIGVYGVLSYDIAQRTREIGIRMALGARRGEVVGLVLRDAGVVVVTGIVLGIAGAWAIARFVRALLFEVSPTDPLTFALGSMLVLAVAFVASLLPGRRAAAVDPVRALRAD